MGAKLCWSGPPFHQWKLVKNRIGYFNFIISQKICSTLLRVHHFVIDQLLINFSGKLDTLLNKRSGSSQENICPSGYFIIKSASNLLSGPPYVFPYSEKNSIFTFKIGLLALYFGQAGLCSLRMLCLFDSSSSSSPSSIITLGYRAMASQLPKNSLSNLPSLIISIRCFPPFSAVFVLPVYGSKRRFKTFPSSCPGDLE